MDLAPLRSRPPGVIAVVLLTVLYGIYSLVVSLIMSSPEGLPALVPVLAGFATAYLLWRGRFIGWVAAVVLYALLTWDLALRAMVFGFTQTPLVAVTVGVFTYLLIARQRVYSDGFDEESTN